MLCSILIPASFKNIAALRSVEHHGMIAAINAQFDGMEQHESVSIRTEFEVYSPDTARILVYWENNANEDITFGVSWNLFRKQRGEFVPVFRPNESGMWILIGFRLRPGETTKHVYDVRTFTDRLTSGVYKIKTHFHSGGRRYIAQTKFEVSRDSSRWSVSVLDYDGDFFFEEDR